MQKTFLLLELLRFLYACNDSCNLILSIFLVPYVAFLPLFSSLRQDQVTGKRDKEASCIWKAGIHLDVWCKKENKGDNYLETNQKINVYPEFCRNYKGKVRLGKGQVMQIAFTLDSCSYYVKFVVVCKTVISSVLLCDLCNPTYDMEQMSEPHFDGIS